MSYVPEQNNIEPAASVVSSGRKGPGATVIAFGVIALLAVVFFFQNSEVTYIDFLIFEKRTTIRWSIMMAVILGVVLDRLFSNWWRRRKSNKAEK
jgi:uncharacterized integral membrane protein